jgi:hypothetical protein
VHGGPRYRERLCRWPAVTAGQVIADTPLGPEQAAFGTSRAGAVDVALYTTASVDAVPAEHPEVDWEQLRAVEKGRRSPLAALRPEPAPVPA